MRCLAQEPERTPWSPPDRFTTPLASSQIGEQETFISELLNELTLTIQDLETHQIHMFYEAVGLMIGADTTREKQEHYLVCSTVLSLSLGSLTCVSLSYRRQMKSLATPVCDVGRVHPRSQMEVSVT